MSTGHHEYCHDPPYKIQTMIILPIYPTQVHVICILTTLVVYSHFSLNDNTLLSKVDQLVLCY